MLLLKAKKFFKERFINIATYSVTMDTTIQVSNELMEKLRNMKVHKKESYEHIIWDLIEDRMEFSDETKKNIARSEIEIKKGKTISLQELKKKRGI